MHCHGLAGSACPRAGAQPECASRKKPTDSREPVFFIRPQALEASSKNALAYDGWSSGAIIYAYVNGNPLSYTDPKGLDAIFVHYIGYSLAITNDISAPLGHAGAVAVDPVTGKTQYYEFGRYGGKCGNVRGPFDVGRVVFDKDGNPTRDSIEAVLKTASSAYGKNSPTYYEYSKKPYQDVIDYAERRKREADTCERPYMSGPG